MGVGLSAVTRSPTFSCAPCFGDPCSLGCLHLEDSVPASAPTPRDCSLREGGPDLSVAIRGTTCGPTHKLHKLPRFCQRDPRGSQTSTARSTRLHTPTFIHADVSSHHLPLFKTHQRGPSWDFFFSFCPAFFTARCLLRTSFLEPRREDLMATEFWETGGGSWCEGPAWAGPGAGLGVSCCLSSVPVVFCAPGREPQAALGLQGL